MSLARNIVLACWIFFVLYWLISARGVKPAVKTTKKFVGFWPTAGRLFIALLVLEGFSTHPLFPFAVSLLPRGGALRIAGSILTVVGLSIAFVARRTIAGNWSGNVEIKQDHELMTTGVYGLVRHPIYTGVLIMSLGTFLVGGNVAVFLFFLSLLLFFLFKVRKEEELLSKHFPADYPAYSQRVKKLIPFLY